VTAWVDKGGFFFLRTVTPYCSPYTRNIVLDFSVPVDLMSCPAPSVSDQYGNMLNICGTNSVPDVRVIANSLFKDTALVHGTTVTVPFLVQPSFSGGTVFELDFEQPVPVPSGDSTFRVLEAPAGAVAELYKYVNGAKHSLGRYYMPFELTVTKR